MVVAHASPVQPPQSTAIKRKNRRKLHKKPDATPQEPHASSSHLEQDEELADITETPSQPIDTSSLFPVPQKLSVDPADDDDDELMIDASAPSLPAPSAAPVFPPAAPSKNKALLAPETRRVPIPPHRMTPLKKDWVNIFGPLTEILGLQVRMNVQRRCVEIRVCASCSCSRNLGPDFRTCLDFKIHKRHWRNSEGRRFRQSICPWFRRQRQSAQFLCFIPLDGIIS